MNTSFDKSFIAFALVDLELLHPLPAHNSLHLSLSRMPPRISIIDVPNAETRSAGTYEAFWQVDDPAKIAKIVLNERKARKYFSLEVFYKEFFSETNEDVVVDSRSKNSMRKIVMKLAKKKTLLEVRRSQSSL